MAGGCFWGLEKYLQNIYGVIKTQVGYANGLTETPTYEEVCKDSGHAEVVRVEYNESMVSLEQLITLFVQVIDPVSINRQGNDIGIQYRTGIYFEDFEDEKAIRQLMRQLEKQIEQKVQIQVEPLDHYYQAEEYHQKYLDKHPMGYCHISTDAFERVKKTIVDPFRYQAPEKEDLEMMLTSIQFEVTMKNGTEPPYQNEYWNNEKKGIYVDIITGEPLFSSNDKFDACGWPSFTKPIDPEVITVRKDFTHGLIREEVRSRVGNIHLGHVFSDGPKEEGGMRYCINSASLRFIPAESMKEEGYEMYLEWLNTDDH